MRTSYRFIDIDEAIEELVKLKSSGKKATVYIFDYDNSKENRQSVSYDEGCRLIRNAKTIAHNDDPFVPHMELFSIVQEDVKSIVRRGIMHDIILPPKLE